MSKLVSFAKKHGVLTQTSPQLRKKSIEFPIDELKSESVRLNNMFTKSASLAKYAYGMAFPQFGYFKRGFVAVEKGTYKSEKVGDELFKQKIYLNPKILDFSTDAGIQFEACLSVPHMAAVIYRPEWVDVEYYDIKGILQTERLDGMEGRIFQHELDHLDGILFPDRVLKKHHLFKKKDIPKWFDDKGNFNDKLLD
jgi:peptide deformylase